MSAKGINGYLFCATNPLEKFKCVLSTMQSEVGTNRGFRSFNGQVFTISQQKQCLPYLFCKRLVHDDGIFTSCIPITLHPMPNLYFCIQTEGEELGSDHKLRFKVDDAYFESIRQAITYFKQLENEYNIDTMQKIRSPSNSYDLFTISGGIPSDNWKGKYEDILKKVVSQQMEQNP